MIYNHLVKYNGVYYPAGTDVPVGVNPVEDKKAEEVKEKNFLDEFAETVAEDRNAKKIIYTKTEINRMSTADLKKLAKENGIDDDLSGAEIKKALIAKFGL
jgi:Fe-S cluster assembly ATPase SufC